MAKNSPITIKTKKARLMMAKDGNWNSNCKVADEYIHGFTPMPCKFVNSSDKWKILCFKVGRLPHHRYKACSVTEDSMVLYSVQAECKISIVWNGEEFRIDANRYYHGINKKYPDQVIDVINEIAMFSWRDGFMV